MKIPERHSIVLSVTDSLREAILLGEFREHLPGVRKLSNDLHVSVPTILSAIHALEKEGIVRSTQSMRTAILVAAGRTKRRKTPAHQVAFLTFAPNYFVGSQYYHTVVNELKELGLSIRFFECEHKRRTGLLKHLKQVVAQYADCWVLFGAPSEVQTFFTENQLPCLLDGVTSEGLSLPDFEVDFDALFRHALHHLRNNGHSRICLITSEHSARINSKSMEVFRETLRKGHPDMPDWDPVWIYDDSTEHFKTLLKDLFFGGHPAPTALVIAGVQRVATAMTWLMKHGLRIPEDVSIISRDHTETLDCLHPLPCHYRQPLSAAKRFVRAIIAIIDKKHIRRHTRIMTNFYPGDTVSKIGPA